MPLKQISLLPVPRFPAFRLILFIWSSISKMFISYKEMIIVITYKQWLFSTIGAPA